MRVATLHLNGAPDAQPIDVNVDNLDIGDVYVVVREARTDAPFALRRRVLVVPLTSIRKITFEDRDV
jgi:hypothetical protein